MTKLLLGSALVLEALLSPRPHRDKARMNRLGFILRQDWAALDFGEERELAPLRRLWESIELEIARVLEAGQALRESPDYELHRLTTQTPAFFDETVRRHVEGLEKEIASLAGDAESLAKEIEELMGEAAPEIR